MSEAVAIGIGDNTPSYLFALGIEGMDLLAAVAAAVVGIRRAVVFAVLFGIALVGGVVDIVGRDMIAVMAAHGILAAVGAFLALVMLVVEVMSDIIVAGAQMPVVSGMISLENIVIAVFVAA